MDINKEKTLIGFSIPVETDQFIEVYAQMYGMKKGELLRRIIDWWLALNDREKQKVIINRVENEQEKDQTKE